MTKKKDNETPPDAFAHYKWRRIRTKLKRPAVERKLIIVDETWAPEGMRWPRWTIMLMRSYGTDSFILINLYHQLQDNTVLETGVFRAIPHQIAARLGELLTKHAVEKKT